MLLSESQLAGILRVGHDTSMRGEGISLRDAIARCNYERLRTDFSPSELVPRLKANPELITQWVLYCEDKRTSGGYWISKDSFEVGTLAKPLATIRYKSIEDAVSQFVVHELDYWTEVGRRSRRKN